MQNWNVEIKVRLNFSCIDWQYSEARGLIHPVLAVLQWLPNMGIMLRFLHVSPHLFHTFFSTYSILLKGFPQLLEIWSALFVFKWIRVIMWIFIVIVKVSTRCSIWELCLFAESIPIRVNGCFYISFVQVIKRKFSS